MSSLLTICFNEDTRLAEDYEFYLKVYNKINDILFLDYAGYYYVQETENSAITLNDNRIDYWKQIEIQEQTKQFLKGKGCFGETERQLYLKRVTGYVYTILILQEDLDYKKYTQEFSELKKRVPDVTIDLSGLSRLCMALYDRNWMLALFCILRIRKMVRKICQK